MSNLEELQSDTSADDKEDVKELTTAEIQAAFDKAVEADSSPDVVKVAMLSAGAAFNGVTTLFNKLMVASGRAMSKIDKLALVGTSCIDEDLRPLLLPNN